jgi:hypothetical protein
VVYVPRRVALDACGILSVAGWVSSADERREMSRTERAVYDAWRYRESAHFGVCVSCARARDEEDRPLYITGKRRERMQCLRCFDEEQAKLGVRGAVR